MTKRRPSNWLETPVEVRITFPTSNMHGLSAQIQLADRMSGKSLATLDLTSTQFTELLAARNVTVMGELLPSEHYASVGKELVAEVVEDIPERYVKYRPNWNAERTRLEGPTEDMEAWAKLYAAQYGWEGYSWSHHNYGWSLRVHRYDATTTEQRRAVLERFG